MGDLGLLEELPDIMDLLVQVGGDNEYTPAPDGTLARFEPIAELKGTSKNTISPSVKATIAYNLNS